MVLVDGDPGIGKSLLLRDSVSEAARQEFSLATAAADPMSETLPFSALRAALREPFEKPASGAAHDPPGSTASWIIWIRTHLERRTVAAPLLVCLDDLQWAGPATLAALRTLPGDLKRHPIAWLLARSNASERAADQLFELLEKDGAARVTLKPLDQDAVAAMLADALGAPPDEALAGLARDAAGTPALVAELIGGLRDEGGVQVTGGRAVLASSRLPRRIHRHAQRRLDDLGKQARQVLVMAAVLGPAFRLEDAAEMLGQTPAALLPAVEETMDAAITRAAEHSFAFCQPLLRRAIGELIPQPARTALHRQYGEILLSRGGSADRAAGHLLQAAHPADRASLADLDKAAKGTLGSAPQTAADLAVSAFELTPQADPAAPSRAVAATEALTAAGRLDRATRIAHDMLARPLPPAAEDRLRCALSSLLCAAGRPGDAADEAQTVLDRPQPVGDLRDLALAARLRALAGLRDDSAGPAADTILTAMDQYGDCAITAALVTRALTNWDSGHVGHGLELLRHAARRCAGISLDARHVQPILVLAAALIDLRRLGAAEELLRTTAGPVPPDSPAGAVLSLLRGRLQLAAGRLDDAGAHAEAALTAAQALGAHGYAATAHCLLSAIELRRGDTAAAARHIAGRLVAGPQFADIYARAETLMAEAHVTEAVEGPAAALGHIRRIRADLPTRPGLLLGDPALAAWLARTAMAAGDTRLAADVAHAAQTLADTHPGFPALAAAAAHSRGVAHREPPQLAEAAVHHPDPWARASAAEDIGVLSGKDGDQGRAVPYLNGALDGYRQLHADRDQARIRRRLRELGIRHRHWTTLATGAVTGWDSLTGTEQAVAALVAQGLNNKQVAARMYISPHTVAHHLRQSFRKLSIASRVDLTRIVIEQTTKNA